MTNPITDERNPALSPLQEGTPEAGPTPGPWEIHEYDDPRPNVYITGEGDTYVAAIEPAHAEARNRLRAPRQAAHANARLIAAAPDLLSALNKLINGYLRKTSIRLSCDYCDQPWESHEDGCQVAIALALIARVEERTA